MQRLVDLELKICLWTEMGPTITAHHLFCMQSYRCRESSESLRSRLDVGSDAVQMSRVVDCSDDGFSHMYA